MPYPISPIKVYFLQKLVLFYFGGRIPPEKIKAEMSQILRLEGKTREEIIYELQEEANRLRHGINVSEVLARAQA